MIFGDLVTAILAFHNDPEIEQTIPTFIALAEAQMNRVLRVREMWGYLPINIACERAPLPRDFAAVESLRGPHGKLTYVSPQMMDEEEHACWGAGYPAVFQPRNRYTIAGGYIVFPHLFVPGCPPLPACMARMRYRKRLAPISGANTTNWCLERNPDAYVYGSLVQSLAFKADDRGDAWTSAYDKALADIEDADRNVIEDSLEMTSGWGPLNTRHYEGGRW